MNALQYLQTALNTIHANNEAQNTLPPFLPQAQTSSATPRAVNLESSPGFTVLPNIDMPFHSSLLRSGIAMYRYFVQQTISVHDVDPKELKDLWVPNLVGIPFSLDSDFVRKCIRRTCRSEASTELLEARGQSVNA